VIGGTEPSEVIATRRRHCLDFFSKLWRTSSRPAGEVDFFASYDSRSQANAAIRKSGFQRTA